MYKRHVEDLSNWYVRRSRTRFWGNVDTVDTRAAFRTLWEVLREVALLAAPCVPFVSDWLHRAITDESVHLQQYPRTKGMSDSQLEEDMDAARALVSLGRAAREEVQIRVRQPLRRIQAVIPGGQTLTEEVLNVVKEELNVKEVSFLTTVEGIVTLVARPNFRSLGQRFGKQTNDAANCIRALSQESLSIFRDGGSAQIELNGEIHELEEADVDVLQEASSGLVVKGEGAYTVALDPELDDELIAEGVARELVNRIQRLRKDSGLDITDRIELVIGGPDIYTNSLESNYFITNPIPASDGKSLFVASDAGYFYVWRNIPEESGAHPDYIYSIGPDSIAFSVGDLTLHNNTLILVGREKLLKWNKLPLTGEPPDVLLNGQIGTVKIGESTNESLGITGVAMDDKYFYLGLSTDEIYVWDGFPEDDSDPVQVLKDIRVLNLHSDGDYLVASNGDSHTVTAVSYTHLTLPTILLV